MMREIYSDPRLRRLRQKNLPAQRHWLDRPGKFFWRAITAGLRSGANQVMQVLGTSAVLGVQVRHNEIVFYVPALFAVMST